MVIRCSKWFLPLFCSALFLAVLFYSSTEFSNAARLSFRNYFGFRNRTPPGVSSIQLQSKGDPLFLGDSKIEISRQMSNTEVDTNFFKFLSKRHFDCENNMRLGNILDGGWDACLAEPYHLKPPCLVYSFGINNDFSFDDAVSSNFNCTVRCFDPSMKAKDHRRSTNVWFYAIGIGGENIINKKGWKLSTLSTIIKSMNESNVIIDYLKMDVEGAEWPSLVQMLANGTLSKVKQFGVELHIENPDTETLFNRYDILKALESQGFRRWYYSLNLHKLKKTGNGFRSCCYEMVYINTNFLK